MDPIDDVTRKAAAAIGITLHFFDDVEALGAKHGSIPPVWTNANDISTVVFTSGSTGVPKGAVFTDVVCCGLVSNIQCRTCLMVMVCMIDSNNR
jgi:acyl-coenzyme A synthetase/AMP-(fatty) acid ligase